MKAKPQEIPIRFQFKVLPYGHVYYPDRLAELQALLDKKPDCLKIELMGRGEISADTALAIRSVLLERDPGTHIIMHARSSLVNGSVLVWLLGDERTIRADARIFFRAPVTDEDETWHDFVGVKYRDAASGLDLNEIDHSRVLDLINEFLPVKEFAGRQIGPADLRQFGLIESDQMDRFLASATGAADAIAEDSDKSQLRSPTETPQN